jgi:tetratricopeptide (TPR) repeat protein
MRLLELKSSGECSLTRDLIDNIPPYAILSHTWGEDNEEVTFQDITHGVGKSKVGYRKIQFCKEQATRDGIRYVWVDTCCIDKANNTELSEAINSMFCWYREAAKCYVYLSDVSTDSLHETNRLSGLTWESAFRRSRWFTRGWTLQELIAPVSVEFFSREGNLIGNKKSLEQQVHEITGIPIKALQRSPLSHFSIPERISWAEHRETRRKEDKVYSLLGIFNVHMPLIYGEGREKAFMRLHDGIDRLARNFQLPNIQQGTFKASWIMPLERNSRFVGRESQLAQLEEMAFSEDRTTRIAITGLGGVGKTQLAVELAFRTKAKYKNCSIIWIPTINIENVKQAYINVAQQLCIPGWEEEKADIKRLVQGYLSKESAGQWLLIFDNADNIDMWINKTRSERESGRLIEYLPRSKQGCIVFTTRDRKTAVKLAQQDIVEVSEMDEEVATQLLKKHLLSQNLVSRENDVRALLTRLTYLPLAIVQAAAYINENGILLTDYLSLLEDQEEEVIDLLSEEFEDDGRYRNVKNPVATTWLISFEQICQRDPLAAEFLSFMACIDPKGVPQSLLPPGPSRKKEIDAIGTLDAYSFITRRSADLAFDIHRLVHLATRSWLRKQEVLVEWTEKVVSRLNDVFPDNDHQNISIWRRYLAHTRCALGSNLIEKSGENRISLAWKFGLCLYFDGRFNEAEDSFMEVMETRKRVLGVEHPDTLISMVFLSSIFRRQARLKEAEELGVQVIEIGKRVLGVEHPSTLKGISNLASTYREQGRLKEAEELGVQVMEMTKTVFGAEHPSTLRCVDDLVSTYWRQNRLKEAEELGVQAVETNKRVLGTEHFNTLTSMAYLASTYRDQGRLKEAEELGVQLVETTKRVLGEEHLLTLSSMSNLVSTYWRQGRWKETEELGVQVIETRKRIFGIEHPSTLRSMSNLASTYRQQGRLKEAEELGVQVIEAEKRVLGAEYPDTLRSMSNLASTYRRQGRLKEAEELGVQVMETEKRVLGAEHPDTLRSMSNLAYTWERQGRDTEALKLMDDCIQLRTRVLGVDHPDTISCSTELIRWYTEKLGIGS